MAAEALVKSVITKLKDLAIQEAVAEWKIQHGIDNDIKFICDELSTIKAVLMNAEKRRVRDELMNQWVAQLRDEAYKIEDVLEEFQFMMESYLIESEELVGCLGIKFCIRYVHTFFKQMGTRHQFHSQIEIIRKEVDDISTRRQRYKLQKEGPHPSLEDNEETRGGDHGVSNSFVEEDDIVGINQDVDKLREWLLKEEEAHRRSIISVVGMGGSGKTTLVKKVYKSISGGEFECNAWVSVSQDFQVKVLLKRMVQEFHKSRNEAILGDMETMELDKLREMMYKYLQGKRYVLVFDDIWDVNAWEDVKYALPHESGGRVIFTTRILDVASPIGEICYIHQVESLSDDLAWSLFCRKAFNSGNLLGRCPMHLKRIGGEMVKRCVGLPLAVVVIGGLMSKKGINESEWNDILKNLDWELSNNQDLERLNQVLLTSYNYLPPHLKYCFLYCGMFPEDCRMKTSRLIRMWVAEGFIEDNPRKTLEEVAHGYLVQLIDRNMLQAAVNELHEVGLVACRMHDIMRDIAIHIIKKEEFGKIFTKQRDTRIFEEQRRVTIQNSSDSIPSNTFSVKTRSFLTFSVDKFFSLAMLQMVFKGIKRLRVLDLSGTNLEHLPSNVVDLIHLRYLSVRGTLLNELPASLHRLHNLQTLDARDTKVESSLMYPQLRHLLFSYMRPQVHLRLTTLGRRRGRGRGRGRRSNSSNLQTLGWVVLDESLIKVHLRLSTLGRGSQSSNLQTLGEVAADESLVSQLCYLTQLRKLKLQEVKEEYCVKLCAAVEKMQHLRSLSIKAYSTKDILDVETNMSAAPPLHLEKLELWGVMKEEHLPQWTCSLKCLQKCVLGLNNLMEDPVSTLAQLPNLEVLILKEEAYLGRQIGWGGTSSSNNEGLLSFPKLKYLGIRSLPELEELSEIKEGMMPALQALVIIDCPKLKKLPHGFQHLKSLHELRILNMPEDFIKRLRRHHHHCEGEIIEGEEGNDHWMIKHIPTVTAFQFSDDGEWLRESIN